MVCQETGHLGLLILSVRKDYVFPLKHKETEDTLEDGTVTKRVQMTHFSSAFYPQFTAGLQTRSLSIWRGYFTAWMLGTCSHVLQDLPSPQFMI